MSNDDQVTVSVDRGVSVVHLGADLDSIYESELTKLQMVRELADTAAPPVMLIDLSNVKYFGSSFIGLLMATANRLKERGDGRLGLCGLAPFARMAFESTKTDTIFALFNSRDEGLAAMASHVE